MELGAPRVRRGVVLNRIDRFLVILLLAGGCGNRAGPVAPSGAPAAAQGSPPATALHFRLDEAGKFFFLPGGYGAEGAERPLSGLREAVSVVSAACRDAPRVRVCRVPSSDGPDRKAVEGDPFEELVRLTVRCSGEERTARFFLQPDGGGALDPIGAGEAGLAAARRGLAARFRDGPVDVALDCSSDLPMRWCFSAARAIGELGTPRVVLFPDPLWFDPCLEKITGRPGSEADRTPHFVREADGWVWFPDVGVRLLAHPESKVGAARWFLTAAAWIGARDLQLAESPRESFVVAMPMHGSCRDSLRIRPMSRR